MGCMDVNERAELVDMVAQAVIDRMEERNKVNSLVDIVIQRIIALQQQESALNKQQNTSMPTPEQETQDVEAGTQN